MYSELVYHNVGKMAMFLQGKVLKYNVLLYNKMKENTNSICGYYRMILF